MLSIEDNKRLTETGPGTPMGELLRRYWLPAMLSEELPKPDCPPVRIKLLGENLVAIRDTNHNVALLDEFCPHRRASLFFGRNEEGGLRCVYHGWKFDACGKCVDMPSEPAESNFKDKVAIKSYPCKDFGGVIWAYLGPPECMPELPSLEWCLVPETHRYFSRRIQECNYFQAVEGGIDSSHISFLHRRQLPNETSAQKVFSFDRAPKFEIVKTDYGMLVGAKRRTEDPGKVYWRITQYIMPFYTMVPPVAINAPTKRVGHAWVPMDDGNCWQWSFSWNPLEPLTEEELRSMKEGDMHHAELIPGTFRPKLNKDNDYMINREWQSSGKSFSGIKGIGIQDCAVQESAGAIADRSIELLGTSDTAIIVARRLLLSAAKGLQNGEIPPGSAAGKQKVRSASVILDAGVPFQEGAKDELLVKETDYVANGE